MTNEAILTVFACAFVYAIAAYCIWRIWRADKEFDERRQEIEKIYEQMDMDLKTLRKKIWDFRMK